MAGGQWSVVAGGVRQVYDDTLCRRWIVYLGSDLGIRHAIGSLTLGPGHLSLHVDIVRVMGPMAIRVRHQAAGLLGP